MPDIDAMVIDLRRAMAMVFADYGFDGRDVIRDAVIAARELRPVVPGPVEDKEHE